MEIEEILSSNNLPLIKKHLKRLYNNYSLSIKREKKFISEKIELLNELKTSNELIKKLDDWSYDCRKSTYPKLEVELIINQK